MSITSLRHPLRDRRDDLYETPAEAVHALLRVESFPEIVWEPACGPGAIVQVLRNAGHKVTRTDLVDWGCPDCGVRRRLPDGAWRAGPISARSSPIRHSKLAAEFVAHALQLGIPKVAMLLRLAFLEVRVARRDILDGGLLARVHVFRNRLPMMHRARLGRAAGLELSTRSPGSCGIANTAGRRSCERISWEQP